MNELKKESKVGKIVKGVLAIAGGATAIGCIIYVGKEVKREYDETVDENNRLRNFINSHDFYEKEQTNFRSTDYEDNEISSDTEDDEVEDVPMKFDRNNPIYRQSPRTMRKLGLNPDGTRKSKSKNEFVKIDEYVSQSGYIVEVLEDIPSGLHIHNPTNRLAKESETKEA